MKALVYEGPKSVAVRDIPVAELKEGQAKIRVTYCGICGSDIGIYVGKHPRAKAPLVLGHEFVGVIEEIKGNSNGFKVGDRVAPYPLISCGECYACKSGTPHICKTLKLIGIDMDGGAAEYVNCDTDVLFKVDENLSNEAAAVIEPLAVIVRTLHQAKFKALDTTVVMGAGPIGILTAIMLKHCGASKIIISDIDVARLEMCKSFGFDAVNVKNQNLVDYVEKVTDGRGVDVVFECSGSEPAALEITKLCRIGGTICATGVHKMPHAVNLQDVNFKEQTIVGSRVYTKYEFGQAVEYANILAPQLEKIVTNVLPLESSDNAFDIINDSTQNTVKVLIDCR